MKKHKSIFNQIKKWDKEKFQFWKSHSDIVSNPNKREIKFERMRRKRAGEYYSKDFLNEFGWVPGKRI
ncbi:MAG: hypothetical protein ACFFG0_43895 [Candidatus Thorarchaeota archaeon]